MRRFHRLAGFFLFAWLLSSAPLWGQTAPDKTPFKSGLSDLLGGPTASGKLSLSAQFQVEKDGRNGKLAVTGTPSAGWHVFSITQRPDNKNPADRGKTGPKRTTLTVTKSTQWQITGKFTADRDPKTDKEEFFDFPSEMHHEAVTWTAPIRLADGVDPQNLKIEVQLNGQICDDNGKIGCIEKDETFVAAFGGAYQPTVAGPYHPEKSHITFRGYIQPETAQPGGKVKLVIEATPENPYHIYAFEKKEDPDSLGNKPTLLVLTKTDSWKFRGPTTSAKPIEHKSEIPTLPDSYYYEQPVQWVFEIEVPRDAEGENTITGIVGFQTCTENTCDQPDGVRFQVKIPVGSDSTGNIALAFEQASFSEASKAADLHSQTAEETEPLTLSSIGFGLMAAFLGGLILNIMPCVLPVIGLKLMSFVQQAGENRMRIFALNGWYSLGMIFVFLVFAAVAVGVKLAYGTSIKWGEQFGNPLFSIPMAALLFVLGLSLLGVWEIPIPGFIGSGKASKMASKEGLFGAFFKGTLTTLLATPCSGPFILTAVGFAVAAPIWLCFIAFAFMGLGMATPFLLVGLFPAAIRFLPKPGEWMDTFKQVMGFVLMATIVWFFSFIERKYTVSTLSLLMGLGIACWLIGRTPMTAEFSTKLKAWAGAGLVTVIAIWFSFVFIFPKHELPWKPYTPSLLAENLEKGNPVFIDFTADW